MMTDDPSAEVVSSLSASCGRVSRHETCLASTKFLKPGEPYREETPVPKLLLGVAALALVSATTLPVTAAERQSVGARSAAAAGPSTTLAELLTPLLAANPFSTVRTSLRR